MIKTSLIYLIKFYQYLISYLTTPSCRFYPSCSEYTIQALKIHGAIKGSYLGMKRILRCNPFFKGGIDFPYDN